MMRLALFDPPPLWQSIAWPLVPAPRCVKLVHVATSHELLHPDAWHEFLTVQRLDAVYLASWPTDDAEIVATILESGCRLLLTPPSQLDRTGWERLEGILRQWPGQWAVATPQRDLPYVAAARQAMLADKLGPVGALRIHAWEAHDSGGAFETCPAQTTGLPQRLAKSLYDQIDAACWLLQEFPLTARVFAYRHAGCLVHLRFPRGAMAMLDVAHFLPRQTEPYLSVSVIGARGAYYGNDQHNVHLQLAGSWTAIKADHQAQSSLIGQLERFEEDLQDPDRNLRELHTVRRIHQLIEDAYRPNDANLAGRTA